MVKIRAAPRSGLDWPALGVTLGCRVDIHPLSCTVGPDVHDQLHIPRRIERADFQYDHFGRFFALAVERRAAVAAEKPVQNVSALRGISEVLGVAGSERHGLGRYYCVMA